MTIRATLRVAILERDSYICRYCGYAPPEGVNLRRLGCRRTEYEMHVDHVIPVSKGGTDDPENLVAACAQCNLEKYDRVWKPIPLELM